MAKRTKQPAQAGQDWSAPAAELLAELPADRDCLLAAAVAAVVEIGYTDLMVDGAPLPHQPDTIIRWLIDRLRS